LGVSENSPQSGRRFFYDYPWGLRPRLYAFVRFADSLWSHPRHWTEVAACRSPVR